MNTQELLLYRQLPHQQLFADMDMGDGTLWR